MSELSQILTIAGLFLEFLSIAYTARMVFPPKSREEKKRKYIEQLGKTVIQEIESREKEWYVVLGLLSIGLILQGIAVFV